jgi:hypothetical protein
MLRGGAPFIELGPDPRTVRSSLAGDQPAAHERGAGKRRHHGRSLSSMPPAAGNRAGDVMAGCTPVTSG